ncbi:2Fe-2S iron-sulfur cluster-binding protein [Jannaschia ovalis]|uniref:2Fe-2S iron-sulfur cluster-binding protein n=1 Tax=Jannaschia ovalis TaxID=3038773 RepID=A0ABY8LFY3_9RHOB|nr:2Fe-2S iron-sulfur cluster-binding protein [Jannaschia sp. GRR-S6-38]WGH80209.1 2Fe-2S iron-sulfur cluster-binding protein [Jannaschia sp. GRR-S6-38]
MARFHDLTVTDLRHTTRDAVVITFDAPDGFDWVQGQYLTLRRTFDGTELRRSYSICAAPGEPLQVAVKRVEGGAFSTWANAELSVGDTLQALPPMGRFHSAIAPDAAKHNLFFAAGSGITPILSILKTVLALEPRSKATLVYANRAVNAIMFREELDDLKSRNLARLAIVHVLGQDAQDIDLFTGRIDAEKLDALFAQWIRIDTVDEAFICGPEPLMKVISAGLETHGLPREAIHFELFAGSQTGRLPQRAGRKAEAKPTRAAITLEGATETVEMERDQSILEAALAAGIDAPYACKAGVCSTCICKVTRGEVEMIQNHALEDYEVEAGYVLSCQSYPLTDDVAVEYYTGH